MTAVPHGAYVRYRKSRCRCDLCVQANRTYLAQYRARVRGTLEAGDSRHGTLNGYQTYGCRCAPCRAANTEYTRSYRKAAP